MSEFLPEFLDGPSVYGATPLPPFAPLTHEGQTELFDVVNELAYYAGNSPMTGNQGQDW
jgi:hypothetical protein